MAPCKWKACSRVAKATTDESSLLSCGNNGCEHSRHRSCLATMLSTFGGKESFDISVCGKRCYNAAVKARRLALIEQPAKERISWHNDADRNNYNHYRGGEGQSGETKQTLETEMVDAIVDSEVFIVRAPKDVMNKILGLETSSRSASDWLANTGQEGFMSRNTTKMPKFLRAAVRYGRQSSYTSANIDY
ncbi:hypothetical protein GN958_ATG20868 [Phytophthora infestans]|uniref:Uncharacterized protein n=1 Tax=Phytophthora infestans TaxID=4787 RepID=A0A8S9TLY9_PHYIN|nr:hypothetical protein GN958_ATG20868 [Phytophthora infestans]